MFIVHCTYLLTYCKIYQHDGISLEGILLAEFPHTMQHQDIGESREGKGLVRMFNPLNF